MKSACTALSPPTGAHDGEGGSQSPSPCLFLLLGLIKTQWIAIKALAAAIIVFLFTHRPSIMRGNELETPCVLALHCIC